MNAGIDFGATRTKVVYFENGKMQFAVVPTNDPVAQARLLARLHEAGVTTINTTGIGSRPDLVMFSAQTPSSYYSTCIEQEIACQAAGVRFLLGKKGVRGSYMLVSIGTGTSFVRISADEEVQRYLGSSIGGGFVQGMCTWAKTDIGLCASVPKGTKPLDLFVRDFLPWIKGKPAGKYVVSSFGAMTPDATPTQILATALHTVSIIVSHDIAQICANGGSSWPNLIVYIGTLVSRAPALRGYLTEDAATIGKTVLFPKKGEYAAAIGALLTNQE